MQLVSTIYFKAQWTEPFESEKTSESVFHGTKKETTVNMMHKEKNTFAYVTNNFTQVTLGLTNGGAMHFYLPKAGTDVNALAADPTILQVLREEEKASHPMVELSVPRFKISGKQDLRDMLEKLGVTNVLDPSKADFSPLTNGDELFLSKADHAAVVEIDENGVTAAAYTALAVCGSALPQENLKFVLDRPFLFVVTGWDGSVLFTGVVRNIE